MERVYVCFLGGWEVGGEVELVFRLVWGVCSSLKEYIILGEREVFVYICVMDKVFY